MNYCSTFFCKRKATHTGKLTAKHGKAYNGITVMACEKHTKDLKDIEQVG